MKVRVNMKVIVMMKHICFKMAYTSLIILRTAISVSQLRTGRELY